MSLRRFMIRLRTIRDGYASFDGELFNHIVRVLRMTTGENIILVDEHGTEHSGQINQITRDWVVVKIIATEPEPLSENSTPHITICQALPKGDKIDLILQKGTELGAHDFCIFGGLRSVARVRQEKQGVKLERWNRITTEAARQCRRRTIPQVSWHTDTQALCKNLNQDLRILLWESEQNYRLKELLTEQPKPQNVCIAIGPEGGLEATEAEMMMNHGFKPITLGKRILRTETAALATVSILQYIWDDI